MKKNGVVNMELIKLCTDNSGYIYYYNPKFDYFAFKCSNGNISFNKILASKVTPNNKMVVRTFNSQIEIIVSESDLSEYNPVYSQLLLDNSWNFSDKIVVYFKRTPQNERYNSSKYSYQDIESFVKAKKEETDKAKHLESYYNSLNKLILPSIL